MNKRLVFISGASYAKNDLSPRFFSTVRAYEKPVREWSGDDYVKMEEEVSAAIKKTVAGKTMTVVITNIVQMGEYVEEER